MNISWLGGNFAVVLNGNVGQNYKISIFLEWNFWKNIKNIQMLKHSASESAGIHSKWGQHENKAVCFLLEYMMIENFANEKVFV